MMENDTAPNDCGMTSNNTFFFQPSVTPFAAPSSSIPQEGFTHQPDK